VSDTFPVYDAGEGFKGENLLIVEDDRCVEDNGHGVPDCAPRGIPHDAFGQDDVIDRDSMVHADAHQNTREFIQVRAAIMHNSLRHVGAEY
jgi:hypothetical protein